MRRLRARIEVVKVKCGVSPPRQDGSRGGRGLPHLAVVEADLRNPDKSVLCGSFADRAALGEAQGSGLGAGLAGEKT